MQPVSRLVPPGTLLVALTLLVASAVSAQNQTPPSSTGGAASANAQATGQGSVNADRAGASAQGSAAASAQAAGASSSSGQSAAAKSTATQSGTASSTASSKSPPSASAGDTLASGSSMNAVLTKPVDSKRGKPGDPVTARTTQAASTQSGASIPKDSMLMGHLTQAQARDQSHASSSLGIVFDKAVTRDGRSIPLANVAIQSVAAAEASAAGNVGDMGTIGSAGGMAGGSMAGSRGGGGGLVGRTAGSLGGAVGATAGGVVHGSESLTAAGTGALQAGPGAAGHVGATGLLESQSRGVFGLPGLSLSGDASEAAMGSVITSSGKSVRLDQGTRLLLTSTTGSSATAAPHAAQSPGESPKRRPPAPTEKPKP